LINSKLAKRIAWIMVLGLLMVLTSGAGAQEKGPFLWNGSHWPALSFDAKVGFIKGMGNLADMEMAWGGQGRVACISRAFVDELKTKTIEQIIQEVDKFYKEHPDKVEKSVIEVVLRKCTQVCPPEAGTQEKKK
jgi:hypothetical protein